MADQRIPAAQYLRMSTEHQQYSLENQSAAIQKYAESHGFEIVQTYSDAAKSGVVLKRRTRAAATTARCRSWDCSLPGDPCLRCQPMGALSGHR